MRPYRPHKRPTGNGHFCIVEAGKRDHAALVQQQCDREGLQRDSDVGGERKSHGTAPVEEQIIDRQRGDRHDGARDHGHKGVSRGEERARVDRLRRPKKQRDREDGEVGGTKLRVARGEAAAVKTRSIAASPVAP